MFHIHITCLFLNRVFNLYVIKVHTMPRFVRAKTWFFIILCSMTNKSFLYGYKTYNYYNLLCNYTTNFFLWEQFEKEKSKTRQIDRENCFFLLLREGVKKNKKLLVGDHVNRKYLPSYGNCCYWLNPPPPLRSYFYLLRLSFIMKYKNLQ